MTAPQFASAVDIEQYGEYRIKLAPDDPRPLYRFTDRITADGSSGFGAEPGRYHLYVGWFCPWSQRATIQRVLNGLEDVISINYVDSARDGRGWGFRERYGPDPVNGFRFLREAYEATEPGFDGHVSVPTLWDRATGRIVSNDYTTIDLDLATAFRAWSSGPETYPEQRRVQVDELDQWIGPIVNHGVGTATRQGPDGDRARSQLHEALGELDRRLGDRRYLLGGELTAADVRLWVTLVRYAPVNADRQHGLRSLREYPNLWSYARELYQQPAFGSTTKFESFMTGGAPVADWEQPTQRSGLVSMH